MADIVDFPAPYSPHVSGVARCLTCKHEWVCVAEAGTVDLTCPSCDLERGAWLNTIGPASGEVWRCACDNHLFYLKRTGAPLCPSCGKRATGWANG